MNKIAVIGTGYIGISTVIYFTKHGFDVTGIDVDNKKISLLKEGNLPQKDLLEWLGFDPKPYLLDSKFYNNFEILDKEEFDAIFVAIPTEKDGEPYFKILDAVINNIKSSKNKDTLTVVESTLMPGVSDEHVAPYLKNFAVAPRRDWFTDQEKTIETLPRIVGGNSDENTGKAYQVISHVCKKIHLCNYKEAELVKAVENSIRHLGAVYAQELAWTYPNLDIRKILKLASSKWNVPEYYPNVLGTSGYCLRKDEIVIIQINKEIKMITIEGLYKLYRTKKCYILSYNFDTNKIAFNKISRLHTRNSKTITFTTKGGKITTSEDHIMYIKTDGIWERKADKVSIGDILVYLDELKINKPIYKLPVISNCFPYYVTQNKQGNAYIDISKFILDNETYTTGRSKIKFTHKYHCRQDLPRYIKIDQQFLEILGFYIGEGSISKENHSYRIYFSFHKKEIHMINKVIKFLKRYNINYCKYDDKTYQVTQIKISNKPLARMFETMSGTNSYNAKIPEFLIFYPSPKNQRKNIISLLKGLLNSEGYIAKYPNVFEIFTASKILKNQLLFIFRAFGLKPVVRKHNNDEDISLHGRKSMMFMKDILNSDKLDRVIQKLKKQKSKHDTSYIHKETVKKIIHNPPEKVYSIDVESTNNFFTTGGLLVHNCIPLSTKYIEKARQTGLKYGNDIAKGIIGSDDLTSYKISRIIKDINPKSVGILGIAYLADIKVHILSGGKRLLDRLGTEETGDLWMKKDFYGKIKVNDPLYTNEELKEITKLNTFSFPNDLSQFEILILTAGHKYYQAVAKSTPELLIEATKSCRFILDNTGIWEGINFKCSYALVGRPGWLGKIK